MVIKSNIRDGSNYEHIKPDILTFPFRVQSMTLPLLFFPQYSDLQPLQLYPVLVIIMEKYKVKVRKKDLQ